MEVKRKNDICIFNEVSYLPLSNFIVEVDEIICKVSRESQLIPLKAFELEFLYNESVIVKRHICSQHSDEKPRMEYIVNEVKRHEPSDIKTYKHIIILIQTSTEYPLIMSELQKLNDVTEGLSPKAEIRWALGINEQSGNAITLMIVYSK